MQERQVKVGIEINQQDITRDLEQMLPGLSVSDRLDGEAGTASISLLDVDGKFLDDWFPTRGDTVNLKLTRKNWKGEGEDYFDFKEWEIDEVSTSYPPLKCEMKLNSIATSSEMRQTDKSRSWEKVSLSKIAGDIASEAELELLFQGEDTEIERAEQKEESNLAFLHKLAKQHGLILRVSEKQLILVDEMELEKQEPAVEVSLKSQRVIDFRGRATINEVYDSAEVTYTHGDKAETITGSYSIGEKSGNVLRINKKVDSQAEAEKLAKQELYNKNKNEIKVQLDLIGEFEYISGNVIKLDDSFGFYAGNYLIESADWKIGKGFTASISCRKVIEWAK